MKAFFFQNRLLRVNNKGNSVPAELADISVNGKIAITRHSSDSVGPEFRCLTL